MSAEISVVKAGEVTINGGSFLVDNRRTESEIRALPRGILDLISSGRIALDSFYNSQIRMNEANELAVRDAMVGWGTFLSNNRTSSVEIFDHFSVDDAINAIFSWVYNYSTPYSIMWLHDDDKMKTSFIAQVVAYLLEDSRQLSATYFFDANTDKQTIVPTLVYEYIMQDHRVNMRNSFSAAIETRPTIFKLTYREQLKRLFVEPLIAASQSSQDERDDDIIVLHAFEECNDEGDFQESFLSALIDNLKTIKENTRYPQRLLIMGRRTDRLDDFLMRKLSSRSPVLQRPVQSQVWINKYLELSRSADKMRRSTSDATFQSSRSIKSRDSDDWGKYSREKRESSEVKLTELYQRVQTKEQSREEENSRTGHPTSPFKQDSLLVSPSPTSTRGSLLWGSPVEEPRIQKDAMLVRPPSKVDSHDRVIILMGPLIPEKSIFIDSLTRCKNPWRFYPSTATSNQFFDASDDDSGNGRRWVKAVKTRHSSNSILFVDFPSLGEDDFAAPEILENIATWLKEISKGNTKIAGILYFYPLLESEWLGSSHRNLRSLGQICGNIAARKVIFVRRDIPPPMTPQEEFFNKHYGRLMKDLGAQFFPFDKTAESGWWIVENLLGPPSEDVQLLLQEELVTRPLNETNAARRLYGDLIERHKKKQRSPRVDRNQYDKISAELERLQHMLRNVPPSTPGILLSSQPVEFANLEFD